MQWRDPSNWCSVTTDHILQPVRGLLVAVSDQQEHVQWRTTEMAGSEALDLWGEDGGPGLIQPGKGTALVAPTRSLQCLFMALLIYLHGSPRRQNRVVYNGAVGRWISTSFFCIALPAWAKQTKGKGEILSQTRRQNTVPKWNFPRQAQKMNNLPYQFHSAQVLKRAEKDFSSKVGSETTSYFPNL